MTLAEALELAARRLRHAAHRYHTSKDESAKVENRKLLEDAALAFAIAKLNTSAVQP